MEFQKAVRACKDGSELDILVSARSDRVAMEGVDPWRGRVLMRVRAPPLDGRANKEIETRLSEQFQVPVRIVHGLTARMKTVHIPLERETVLRILEGSA
ncbi:MAG: DUF167 domain-containing protein [Candidatus Methanomethylophilaceae archaeon]